MRTNNKWTTALGAAALAAVAVQMRPQVVTAADHIDAPLSQADAAADIADFYAWPTERGTVVAVVTFAGLLNPGDDPVYDAGTLYTINIDNTADPGGNPAFNDNLADIQIHVRFGQNGAGDWGVQLENVPGATGTLVGPVGEDILDEGTNVRVIAGMFDDPFFFDFEGFGATAMALTDDTDPIDVMFASAITGTPVDFFAGLNVMAIVVEFDATAAADGNADNFVQLWATSGRLP